MSATSSGPTNGSATNEPDAEADERGRRGAPDHDREQQCRRPARGATYSTVSAEPGDSRRISSSAGTIPSRSIPKPAITTRIGAPRARRDRDEAGGELAVDDVVAVDRLREEARQRALVALAVDGIEGEGDAEQRRGDGDECLDREGDRAEVMPSGPSTNSARKTAGGAARDLRERADSLRREVQRDERGDPEDDQQHVEADAQEVVRELLARDRDPAAAEAPSRRASGRRPWPAVPALSGACAVMPRPPRAVAMPLEPGAACR